MTRDAIFIQIRGNTEIDETPAELIPYRDRIQSFVDEHELVVGQEYVVKVWMYSDYVSLCLMESMSRTNLFTDSTGDTP